MWLPWRLCALPSCFISPSFHGLTCGVFAEQTPAGQLMWQYKAVQVLCCTASDAAAQCSDEGCMCIDMVSFQTHGCNLHGYCCGIGWSRGSYWHRFAVEIIQMECLLFIYVLVLNVRVVLNACAAMLGCQSVLVRKQLRLVRTWRDRAANGAAPFWGVVWGSDCTSTVQLPDMHTV